MRITKMARLCASVLVLASVAACGGGGDDGPSYPDQGKLVLNAGTSDTAAGTYDLQSGDWDSGTQALGDGRVVEYAYADTGEFLVEVDFLQNDPGKYVLIFDDESDDYACRSRNLSLDELSQILDDDIDLPVCSGTVRIDAGNHTLKADNVKIPGLDNTSASVRLSANLRWTLE